MTNELKENKDVRGTIAFVLWLISVLTNGLVMSQWTESPWILQGSDYGGYFSLGAFVINIIGLAILGSAEAGSPGYRWNTGLGVLNMLTGAGFAITMLWLTPDMSWAYTNEYRALWWLFIGGFYGIAGVLSMPSKKIPRS